MANKQPKFQADAYLKSTYLDKQGAKHVNFEFSSKDAVEIAKLELMGRDLVNHLPVLLRVTVEMSPDHGKEECYKGVTKKPKQRHYIPRKTT